MVERLERSVRLFHYLKKLCWFNTCLVTLIIALICVTLYVSDSRGVLPFHIEKSLYALPVLLVITIVLLNVKYLNERRAATDHIIQNAKSIYHNELDSLHEIVKGYSELRDDVISQEGREDLGEQETKLIQSEKDGLGWLSKRIELLNIRCDLIERKIRRLECLSEKLWLDVDLLYYLGSISTAFFVFKNLFT